MCAVRKLSTSILSRRWFEIATGVWELQICNVSCTTVGVRGLFGGPLLVVVFGSPFHGIPCSRVSTFVASHSLSQPVTSLEFNGIQSVANRFVGCSGSRIACLDCAPVVNESGF
jgi:hypothetical protein